jgi:drug/metabolite transporter superfamily protein YnfA
MPERPLSRAERGALAAMEAGFAVERRARRRRRRLVLLALGLAVLAVVGVLAPLAALTLAAAVAVAFAGPIVIVLFLRVGRIDDGPEANWR